MNVGSLYLSAKFLLMPRPNRSRIVVIPPKMIGFEPYGMHSEETGNIVLNFDEFESIRYINYNNLMQETAAERMGVSRPTFTRIYQRALKKIAQAFVEGKGIKIGGGSVCFEKEWYRCKKCYKVIQGLENHKKCGQCRSYGLDELSSIG